MRWGLSPGSIGTVMKSARSRLCFLIFKAHSKLLMRVNHLLVWHLLLPLNDAGLTTCQQLMLPVLPMMTGMPLMELILLPCCPWSLISRLAGWSETSLQDCFGHYYYLQDIYFGYQILIALLNFGHYRCFMPKCLFWESGKKNFGLLMSFFLQWFKNYFIN